VGEKWKAVLSPHKYLPLKLSCKSALHCAIGLISDKTFYKLKAEASILFAVAYFLVAGEKSFAAGCHIHRACQK